MDGGLPKHVPNPTVASWLALIITVAFGTKNETLVMDDVVCFIIILIGFIIVLYGFIIVLIGVIIVLVGF